MKRVRMCSINKMNVCVNVDSITSQGWYHYVLFRVNAQNGIFTKINALKVRGQ